MPYNAHSTAGTTRHTAFLIGLAMPYHAHSTAGKVQKGFLLLCMLCVWDEVCMMLCVWYGVCDAVCMVYALNDE